MMHSRRMTFLAGAVVLLGMMFLVPGAWALTAQASYHRAMMAGGGGCGMSDWMGPVGGSTHSLIVVAADKLGMTPADLVAALQNDQTLTIAALAEAKGVGLDTIVNAFLAPHKTYMDEAVREGILTQAAADAHLAAMRTHVTARLTQPMWANGPGQNVVDNVLPCDHMGMPAGHGGGMRRGRP